MACKGEGKIHQCIYALTIAPVIHPVKDSKESDELKHRVCSYLIVERTALSDHLKKALAKEKIILTALSVYQQSSIIIEIQCSPVHKSKLAILFNSEKFKEILSSFAKTIAKKLKLVKNQKIELQIQSTEERAHHCSDEKENITQDDVCEYCEEAMASMYCPYCQNVSGNLGLRYCEPCSTVIHKVADKRKHRVQEYDGSQSNKNSSKEDSIETETGNGKSDKVSCQEDNIETETSSEKTGKMSSQKKENSDGQDCFKGAQFAYINRNDMCQQLERNQEEVSQYQLTVDLPRQDDYQHQEGNEETVTQISQHIDISLQDMCKQLERNQEEVSQYQLAVDLPRQDDNQHQEGNEETVTQISQHIDISLQDNSQHQEETEETTTQISKALDISLQEKKQPHKENQSSGIQITKSVHRDQQVNGLHERSGLETVSITTKSDDISTQDSIQLLEENQDSGTHILHPLDVVRQVSKKRTFQSDLKNISK